MEDIIFEDSPQKTIRHTSGLIPENLPSMSLLKFHESMVNITEDILTPLAKSPVWITSKKKKIYLTRFEEKQHSESISISPKVWNRSIC